ncbi:hypothetical protein BpHYR1_048659 [Brachionus plicatilis]|uniref:Uncharacterized protein n=1 Tax=Brachionus plicatilis TaxID=10195 RepID=A0A3M7RP88_BRAPC|nr:hypothetical protein BpHYR1_048659 [Brachionus plicatilis]
MNFKLPTTTGFNIRRITIHFKSLMCSSDSPQLQFIKKFSSITLSKKLEFEFVSKKFFKRIVVVVVSTIKSINSF